MADFEVKITTEPDEIEEAQRLRFQVFNLELNKGLRDSYARGLDVNEFDPFLARWSARRRRWLPSLARRIFSYCSILPN